MRKGIEPRYLGRRLRWLLDTQMLRRHPLLLLSRMIRWELARAVGRPIVRELEGNLLVVLNPADGYARVIYYLGFNEPLIAQFYNKFLEQGMVYIDCGANIGVYSITAAQRVGSEGAVYSFEPQPDIFHRLLANVHLNQLNNVHAYRLAVGDKAGAVELVQLRDHVASYVRSLEVDTSPTERCSCTTLDAFFAEHPIERADVLKIDVEGYELKVLRGARTMISRFRPKLIQFEYYAEYPMLPRDEWPTLDGYRTFFNEVGYEGFFCLRKWDGRFEVALEDRPQDNDLFCIEGSHMEHMRAKGFFAEASN
jgi:FkbM family methyltransferase